MTTNFDAYHKWLGIPPKDQPPNHYRLLGLELFEPDLDVISDAAEQRMAHVRNYQLGKHVDFSQKILNELATARVCLLNPQKKADYDQMLRAKLTPAAAPPVAQPKESPVAEMDFAPVVQGARKKQKKGTAWWMPWAFPVLGLAVAAVLLMVIANQGGNEVAKAPSAVRAEAKPSPSAKVEPKKEEPKPEPRREPKIEPKPEPVQPKLTMLEEPKGDPKPESKSEPAPAPEPKPEPKSEEPPKKLPVPDDAAQQKTLAAIREVYKDDYKDKAALAKTLIQKADETKNDPTARFVLLQEATSAAAAVLQTESAFEAVDAMAKEYAVSAVELKAEHLQTMAKRSRLSPDQKAAIARAALQVVDEAVGEDDFDVAKKLGKMANQIARLAKDKELVREIMAKGTWVAATAKAYADAQEAMATLKGKPDDPEANLIVGKYQCFSKDDWDKGLPMLAKGSDEKLTGLAEEDVAGAASAKAQVKLGDAWWEAGGKQRAVYWYEKALPDLSGLEKDRVEKRLSGSCKSAASSIKQVYLDDLQPIDFKVGVGQLGKHGEGTDKGKPGTVKGVVPVHSLCTHPPSDGAAYVCYQLGGRFRTFRAAVAIGDDRNAATSLTFRVLGDGKLLWQSRPLKNLWDSDECKIPVWKVKVLTLQVHCPGWNGMAHAYWVDPLVLTGERTVPSVVETHSREIRSTTLRPLPQNNLKIAVLSIEAFNEKLGEQFPPSENKATNGTATATSTAAGALIQRVFTGSRAEQAWWLAGPKGGFAATWAAPPEGRYVLIFARAWTKGFDAWGNAAISINDGRMAPLRDMSNQTVAVVDLGRPAKIKKLAILINGRQSPGMSKIEIH